MASYPYRAAQREALKMPQSRLFAHLAGSGKANPRSREPFCAGV
jgi:hypothetical protein